MITVKKFGLKIFECGEKRVPASAVFIGRPTPAQNPFLSVGKLSKKKDGEEAANTAFRKYVTANLVVKKHAERKLKGKDLVCNCPGCPEHACIIMELANS